MSKSSQKVSVFSMSNQYRMEEKQINRMKHKRKNGYVSRKDFILDFFMRGFSIPETSSQFKYR